jgi:uncharacterized protein (DUF736 family)
MSINAQRENSGVLFRNDRKQSEHSPDYSGAINVGGTEFQLSGWIKTSKNGNKFLSLAIREASTTTSKPEDHKPAARNDVDVPF